MEEEFGLGVVGNCGASVEQSDTVCWAPEDMQFSADPESYCKKISDPKAFESVVVQD